MTKGDPFSDRVARRMRLVNYGLPAFAVVAAVADTTIVMLIVAGGAILYAAANLAIKPWLGTDARLWASALLFSILCLICLGLTWQVVHTSDFGQQITGTPVRTEADVARVLRPVSARSPGLHQVPTGVNVSTVEFVSSHNVRVTGYVWQRYSTSIPDDVSRGVTFPEATDAAPFTEAYRFVEPDGAEVIGWSFHTVLREEFDYRMYPLDRQNLWLRFWHADFDRRVMLVPDFSAYPPWKDHEVIGLDRQYAKVSFRAHYTTFSYAFNDYRSTFGQSAYKARLSHPELYFNIGFDRQFRASLGETLAPLALVAILVFAAIYITSVDHERHHKVGFSTLATLTLTMSAGFIVVTRHKGIIDTTDVGGLIYLELFPYLMYFVIGLAALNAVFYAATDIGWMGWRDNLIPALLYWPVLMGSLLLATILVLV